LTSTTSTSDEALVFPLVTETLPTLIVAEDLEQDERASLAFLNSWVMAFAPFVMVALTKVIDEETEELRLVADLDNT